MLFLMGGAVARQLDRERERMLVHVDYMATATRPAVFMCVVTVRTSSVIY